LTFRKQELQKKAPGYNPGLLVPMSKSAPKPAPTEPKVEVKKEVEAEGLESMITPFDAPVDDMDQLVEQLEQMDGRK
jgi:hypothetical protein